MTIAAGTIRIITASGLALVIAAIGLASPSLASPDLAGMVAEAAGPEGPMITDAERATIRARCGGGEDGDSITSRDGVLICKNGRRIDDPEVRAIVARAGERATAHVAAVMGRPEVAAAIRGGALDAARVSLARVDVEALRAAAMASSLAVAELHGASARLGAVDRSELRTALAEARAAVEGVDLDAAISEAEAEIGRALEELRREQAN